MENHIWSKISIFRLLFFLKRLHMDKLQIKKKQMRFRWWFQRYTGTNQPPKMTLFSFCASPIQLHPLFLLRFEIQLFDFQPNGWFQSHATERPGLPKNCDGSLVGTPHKKKGSRIVEIWVLRLVSKTYEREGKSLHLRKTKQTYISEIIKLTDPLFQKCGLIRSQLASKPYFCFQRFQHN